MGLFAQSEEKLFGEILIDIVNNTTLRRVSPGSKTRAIAQALSKKLGQMYKKFDLNIGLAFLDGAEGKYLDFFGDLLGTPRLGEQPAKVSLAEQNVRFYVDSGTFGSINGGEPILLTTGTVISTSPSGTGITYTIPYNIVISASDVNAYVPAQASRPGAAQNVGVDQLVYHNFTSYSDSANNTLKVTNDAEIVTGQSVETDTNYRFRIANKIISSEQGNLTAIRIAALSVPGVADVVTIPFARGIGTLDLLIKSTTPTVSVGLINSVQAAIDTVSSQGIILKARKPKETGLSLVATLTFKKSLPSTQEQNILSSVTANLTDYIDSLDIGEQFIVNRALEKVLVTSDVIKNVGTTSKPFDSLFIYKESRLEDNKIRSILLDDYSAKTDERIIVEQDFAGATPILVKAV